MPNDTVKVVFLIPITNTNGEILRMITHYNAQLLQLSGLRSPYPGKLGVIAEGALADVLLVDGNPLQNLSLLADPGAKFLLIVKNGVVYKNLLSQHCTGYSPHIHEKNKRDNFSRLCKSFSRLRKPSLPSPCIFAA